jgi:hypothetical protein
VAASTAIHRCPKCGTYFEPARPAASECPECGIWFHKWGVEAAHLDIVPMLEESGADDSLESPDPVTYYGRAAAWIFVSIWGFFLARKDFHGDELMGSFMHAILLPIHEAGHVFFRLFGEFMMVAGGSVFQVLLPFSIGVAFLVKQRDPFGASICLWWTGASLVDLSAYIWDALEPQLILLSGTTGEDGGHDWIYLLGRFNAVSSAHGVGKFVHHLGVLTMVGAIVWGAAWLWPRRPWKR